MKRFLLVASLVVAAAFSAACDQETNLSVIPDRSSFTFGPEGGEFDVVVFTNGYWKATCSDEAVTFVADTGNFTSPLHVKVGPNHEQYTKSMRVSLVTHLDKLSRSANIAITQACNPFLTVADAEKQIGREGGTVRFSVNSNHPWQRAGVTLDGAPYDGTVDPSTGGPNRTDVALNDIPENTTGRPRTFCVTLALVDYPGVTLILTVRQEA